MSKTLRQMIAGLRHGTFALAVGLVFALWFPQAVRADANPANDMGDIEVTITPRIDRGVMIDTENVVLDLGSVDMNASTQTVRPATVTVLGTVTNTELDLTADITGGWNFETVATSTNTDALKVWVVFTATTVFSAPAKNNNTFDNTNDFLSASGATFAGTRVGSSSGGSGNINNAFEDNSGNAFADMDALRPGNKRHLWLYFTTPDLTTTASPQRIRFYFTVKPGS